MKTTNTNDARGVTPGEIRAYRANALALRAHDEYEKLHEAAAAARAFHASHLDDTAAYWAAIDATAAAARAEEKAERLSARAAWMCRMARIQKGGAS